MVFKIRKYYFLFLTPLHCSQIIMNVQEIAASKEDFLGFLKLLLMFLLGLVKRK